MASNKTKEEVCDSVNTYMEQMREIYDIEVSPAFISDFAKELLKERIEDLFYQRFRDLGLVNLGHIIEYAEELEKAKTKKKTTKLKTKPDEMH